MNFKERGFTVGDLLIMSIIVLSTIIIFNKVKDSDKQSYRYIKSYEISTNLNS